MATRKKTAPENEAAAQAAPAAAEKKKTTRTKSPAATHKTTARKAPVRKSALKAAPLEFDAAAHHDEIAREAYFLFLNRGAQHGYEHEDWLRAIEIVKARY